MWRLDARTITSRGSSSAIMIVALIVFNVVLLVLLLTRDNSGVQEAPAAVASSQPTSAPTSQEPTTSDVPSETAAATSPSTSPGQRALIVRAGSTTVNPYQTVGLAGQSQEANSLLRVQRLDDGKWINFPLPTMSDSSGRFAAYVELGKAGVYRLRVVSDATGESSNVVSVTVL